MKIRTLAVVGGLAVAVLTAGCMASVAGQAEVDPGAVASASSSSTGSTGPARADGNAPRPQSSMSEVLPAGTTVINSSETTLVLSTPLTVTARTRISDDKSVPLAPTSIPGASAACNQVIAGITAFSALLRGAGDTETISPAAVATTLTAMPASGLPAVIQPDMTILRSLVSAAAGKSVNDLALGLSDSKAISALDDLSNWTAQNCI